MKSVTKYGQTETTIEYLESARETRGMGTSVAKEILKLENVIERVWIALYGMDDPAGANPENLLAWAEDHIKRNAAQKGEKHHCPSCDDWDEAEFE